MVIPEREPDSPVNKSRRGLLKAIGGIGAVATAAYLFGDSLKIASFYTMLYQLVVHVNKCSLISLFW